MGKNSSKQGKIKTWVTGLVVLLLVAIALLLLNLNLQFGAGKGTGQGDHSSIPATPRTDAAAAINVNLPSNVIQFIVTDLDQIYVREQPRNRRDFKKIKGNCKNISWSDVDELLAKAKRKKWMVEVVIFEKNASIKMKEHFQEKENLYKQSGAGTFTWITEK